MTRYLCLCQAGEVVNPPVVSRPHRLLAAARRLSYDSTLRRPVGSTPLRQPAVPPHLSIAGAATFGTPTKYGTIHTGTRGKVARLCGGWHAVILGL